MKRKGETVNRREKSGQIRTMEGRYEANKLIMEEITL